MSNEYFLFRFFFYVVAELQTFIQYILCKDKFKISFGTTFP